MASFRYERVGYCVYCLSDAVELTDEHIIPYGLNGNAILPEASCKECAKVTSRIENDLLRGEMRQMRAARNFQTRNPKQMPTEFPMLITREDIEETVFVANEDHLMVMPLPLYGAPSFIEPYEYKKGIRLIGFQTFRFGKDPNALLEKHGAEKIGAVVRLDHNLFARLLAKIAICIAIAELKGRRLTKSYVTPLIFGDLSDAGLLVGSSQREFSAEPEAEHSHRMIELKRSVDGADVSCIAVLIRLFANLPTPGYIVIVGETESALSENAA